MYCKGIQAFSLVELSIVLVILGLLIGGVLAGQSLIRAAELRSVSTDINKYMTAVNAFRDKYFAIPGDMQNATSIWGDQATGINACPDTAIPNGSPGTCNGNGNGTLTTDLTEDLRAFQHLAAAGLIEGNYTGLPSVPHTYHGQFAGENIPPLKLNGAALWFRYHPTQTQYGKIGNHMRLGTLRVGTGDYFDGVMRAEEAWNIDTKIDDGLASNGRFMAFASMTSNCVTGHYTGAAGSSNYRLDTTVPDCGIIYWMN